MDSNRDSPDSTIHSTRPLKFDGTVNIPTIVMLVTMLVGSLVSIVGVYNSVDQRRVTGESSLALRINTNEKEIGLLKDQAANARAERDRDRQEMQSTLRDINSKLDQLIWDRGTTTHSPKVTMLP